MSSDLKNKIAYSIQGNPDAEIQFQYIDNPNGIGFSIVNKEHDLVIPSTLFGHYNAINMVAAYTIGRHFNVEEQIISNRLSSFISKSNRSELVSWKGCTVIMDAYNANPSSMELAITAFALQYPDGLVVLGDMKELGTETLPAHRQIIQQLERSQFLKIWLVGNAFRDAVEEMKTKDDRFTCYTSIEEVKQHWNWSACQGKALLLKGSRSMRLERILED